jgi:hypothetical protein
MKIKLVGCSLIASMALTVSGTAFAKVSAEEAARLGQDLTPNGAEMAGNAEGTIPAYTGGIGFVAAEKSLDERGFALNPFAGDQVAFSITPANLEKYASNLSEGQIAMLKQYPDSYRLDVYQTRRSFSQPAWVYENTADNAVRAYMTDDRLGTRDAFGGTPFPITDVAEEIMTNHVLRYVAGQLESVGLGAGVKYPGQDVIMAGTSNYKSIIPYYDKDGSIESFDPSMVQANLYQFEEPARRKGEVLLVSGPLDTSEADLSAWMYMPGQRRVRRSPSVGYDNPNPATGGNNFYDENHLFSGKLDRFDWKTVGKQEMYVPYNNYDAVDRPVDELAADYHLNPDLIRWELHRVWVVEATLKDGKRHAYSKRVFYIDEDSWAVMLSDSYDSRGELWRTGVSTSYTFPHIPSFVTRVKAFYDLQKSDYGIDGVVANDNVSYKLSEERTMDFKQFTPEEVRRLGRR